MCIRVFIVTLFVVTKNWKQTTMECILQLLKALSTDDIPQLLREGKASIRGMCSHDSLFKKKYTISVCVNIHSLKKYLLSAYKICIDMPGTILWYVHCSGRVKEDN